MINRSPGRFLDLTTTWPASKPEPARSVSIGGNPQSEIRPGQIGLVMVISRFDYVQDHAIFYFFIEGPANIEDVAEMLKLNHEGLGDTLIVSEFLERFDAPSHAEQRAVALQKAMPMTNVIFPPIQLFRVVQTKIEFKL